MISRVDYKSYIKVHVPEVMVAKQACLKTFDSVPAIKPVFNCCSLLPHPLYHNGISVRHQCLNAHTIIPHQLQPTLEAFQLHSLAEANNFIVLKIEKRDNHSIVVKYETQQQDAGSCCVQTNSIIQIQGWQ